MKKGNIITNGGINMLVIDDIGEIVFTSENWIDSMDEGSIDIAKSTYATTTTKCQLEKAGWKVLKIKKTRKEDK